MSEHHSSETQTHAVLARALAHAASLRTASAHARAKGLDAATWQVLAKIHITDACTGARLRDELGFAETAIRRSLGALGRAGMVVNDPDPTGGRRRIYQVTDEGRALLAMLIDDLISDGDRRASEQA